MSLRKLLTGVIAGGLCVGAATVVTAYALGGENEPNAETEAVYEQAKCEHVGENGEICLGYIEWGDPDSYTPEKETDIKAAFEGVGERLESDMNGGGYDPELLERQIEAQKSISALTVSTD
ncbi:MAG: hypothetical protein LBI38_05270 [Oscillospiraceae bacterium]|jgi:hypothetical protein|nr:hypothetical protein [Oscillospiraceae bacterium]